MRHNTYEIISTQRKPYDKCELVATKHSNKAYKRPITKTQTQIFTKLNKLVQKFARPVILDSGCGTGVSTIFLASKFKNHLVIGIDRSELRLSKIHEKPDNCLFIRANLEDIWRLIAKSDWAIDHHFIFYPNPYPKIKDYKKRWHGHPVFPTLISLSKKLTLRSDWKIYLEEFAIATKAITNIEGLVKPYLTEEPISRFEEKYKKAGHQTYQLEFNDLE